MILSQKLLDKAKPSAIKEFEELKQFAKDLDGLLDLQPWDTSYYTEKLKQKKFSFDDELLKPYFSLDRVLGGVFEISRRLFGLTFVKNKTVDVYHQEVVAYDVLDTEGEYVALLYTDFHPRTGKRNGAWMTSYKPQQITRDGVNERPHISIVCNFTRPTETKPSLLSFNEVTTLFHEFGHALHGMLANTTYPSLSGTHVFWDFVELPSQILENWCFEEEALALFARHYKTNEILPIEYINKIKKSITFMEGIATLRQLSFSILDLSWHAQDPREISDVKSHEKEVMEPSVFSSK